MSYENGGLGGQVLINHKEFYLPCLAVKDGVCAQPENECGIVEKFCPQEVILWELVFPIRLADHLQLKNRTTLGSAAKGGVFFTAATKRQPSICWSVRGSN